MLARLRPSALFAATFIATGSIAAVACGGPAFTNTDSGGSAGLDSTSGGVATGDGGRGGSTETGGASGSDNSGGTLIAAGGSKSTGGSKPTGGSAAGGAAAGGHSGGTGGTSNSGGGRTGGTSGLGGSGGALGLGGVGGLGVGGLLASGGTPAAKFPSTPVLDDFARENDVLGADWRGALQEFTVRDEQLIDQTDAGQPLVWNKRFGANQEVFATLANFADEAREINLVLKSQEPGNACELLEVMYLPNREQIGLDLCADGRWSSLEPVSAALKPGDRLGARAMANGEVRVYLNGELFTTFDASSFPYRTGGYIGVNALSIPENPATWDDFGGGNAAP